MWLYDAWERGKRTPVGSDAVLRVEARAQVFRGQRLFNSKHIRISDVAGLNDDLGIPVLDGTCSTCHDSPHAGSHSVPAPLDIGLADASRRTPDLPLYTLRNKQTLRTVQTTDPGRAVMRYAARSLPPRLSRRSRSSASRASNSSMLTGLTKWRSNPASRVRSRSPGSPQPVSA